MNEISDEMSWINSMLEDLAEWNDPLGVQDVSTAQDTIDKLTKKIEELIEFKKDCEFNYSFAIKMGWRPDLMNLELTKAYQRINKLEQMLNLREPVK